MGSEKISCYHFSTIFGELILGEFEGQLCLCDWRYRKMRRAIDERLQRYFSASFEYVEKNNLPNILVETQKQLNEYFDKKRTQFDLSFILAGSEFQQKVWIELLRIPYGRTTSYLDLSKKLMNKEAIRAVGSANGANAIAIIVPCHRVIGAKGDLMGYAGGLNVKKKILELEQGVQHTELIF